MLEREALATPISPPTRFPRLRRVLHWAGGPLLLGAFVAGAVAHHSQPGGAVYLLALRAHVLLGISGAALSVVRIAACLRMPVPPPPGLAPWRQKIVEIDHRLLYLSSVLLGLSGLVMLVAGGVGEYVAFSEGV